MAAAAWVMASPARFAAAERPLRLGGCSAAGAAGIRRLPPPLSAWTASRDLPRAARRDVPRVVAPHPASGRR